MADDPSPQAGREPGAARGAGRTQPAWLAWLARGLLVAVLGVVAVAVLLSNTQMAALRRGWPWLSQMISKVERIWPAVDMVHVVMFGVLGLVAALAFPSWRVGRLMATIAVLAGVSEFVQIWVPGRTASVGEVLLDVAAAALGVGIAWAIAAAAGWRRSAAGGGGPA